MSQTWDVTLLRNVAAGGIGDNVGDGFGSAGVPEHITTGAGDNVGDGFGSATLRGATQSWDVAYYTGQASGLGDNVGDGFGSVQHEPQSWGIVWASPLSAYGFGDNTGSGFGDALNLDWYTISGTAIGGAAGLGNNVGDGFGAGTVRPIASASDLGDNLCGGYGDANDAVTVITAGGFAVLVLANVTDGDASAPILPAYGGASSAPVLPTIPIA